MGKGEDQSAVAREKISHGGVTVWEAGGEPVAIACNTMPVERHGPDRPGLHAAGAARPRLRQRGDRGALAAPARRRAPRRSLLYTDLANPVSNSIYQRIGYRPVEDRVVLAFSAD